MFKKEGVNQWAFAWYMYTQVSQFIGSQGKYDGMSKPFFLAPITRIVYSGGSNYVKKAQNSGRERRGIGTIELLICDLGSWLKSGSSWN